MALCSSLNFATIVIWPNYKYFISVTYLTYNRSDVPIIRSNIYLSRTTLHLRIIVRRTNQASNAPPPSAVGGRLSRPKAASQNNLASPSSGGSFGTPNGRGVAQPVLRLVKYVGVRGFWAGVQGISSWTLPSSIYRGILLFVGGIHTLHMANFTGRCSGCTGLHQH